MENNKTNWGLLAIMGGFVLAISIFINTVILKFKIRKQDKELGNLKRSIYDELHEPEIVESKLNKPTPEEIEAELDRRINEMEQ